jgi:hypothetical protein
VNGSNIPTERRAETREYKRRNIRRSSMILLYILNVGGCKFFGIV